MQMQQTAKTGKEQHRTPLETMRFWLINARPVALPQSVMPAVTALLLAAMEPAFSWWLGALAVLGGCLAHLGMNLADDYFDYKKVQTGFRESLAREGIRARTVKCPYITSGEATLNQTLAAAVVFGILALIPGAVVLWFRGWPVLLIVGIAVFLGESYSGNPLRLSYRGLGEPDIGVMFGPLLMAGVYVAACGHLSVRLIIPAVCMGLLVTNVLYVHSVLDIEADRKAQKATLAVLLKTDRARLAALAVILFVPYALTTAAALAGLCSIWYLLVLLTLPMAVHLFQSVRQHVKDPGKPVVRRAIGGPMANWELICKGGLDWFMYRWYMARNLLTAFALVCCVVSLILALV